MHYDSWIERHTRGSPSERLRLEGIAKRLNKLDPGQDAVDRLLACEVEPPCLLSWVELFEAQQASSDESSHAIWTEFTTTIKGSDYALETWLKALSALQQWLKAKGRKTQLLKASGYLSCSIEAAQLSPQQETLEAIVIDMLETYGYAG